MTWLNVQLRGYQNSFKISDSDYMVRPETDILLAFKTQSSNGAENTWILNQKRQQVEDWKSDLDRLISKIPDSAINPCRIAVVGGGLVWQGPRGAACAIAGVFAAQKLYDNVLKPQEPQEIIESGYYDAKTGIKSQYFREEVKLSNILILR